MNPSASRRRTSLWVKLALALVSGALALGACELAARSFLRPVQPGEGYIYTTGGTKVPLSEIVHFLGRSPDRARLSAIGPRSYLLENVRFKFGYSNAAWDYFDQDGCVLVQHNSRGFRDREFPLEKPAGELRVIALGDSFTYGQGVRQDDAWPQVLERSIAAERKGPVEVVNGGFCSGHTPQYYAPWLATDGLAFQPDLVIVGLCLNDLSFRVPMMAYDPAAVSAEEPWLRGSALLGLLQRKLAQRRLAAERRDFGAVVRADETEWKLTQAGLLDMQQRLREKQIGFVVAIFPMLSQLAGSYSYGELHDMVRAFCREHGIACVDLLPKFLGRDEYALWVHASDQHPNDVGHRLMAEGIHEFLREQGLLR
jgi:lysophospholipase L1-like esterase